MMCAHSTPLPAGVPAVQSPSDNILDGGPSVLGAILHCLYTLLAASCDRLRPGAGRWPWVVVVGMYAIPVAWNLVAIQPVAVPAGWGD